MSKDLAATQGQYTDLSLKKQEVFRRYADGELTWSQVADRIESIKPPPPNLSPKQRIAFYVSTFLLALFTPPGSKRED